MNNLVLGLDIGITSVGYGIIDIKNNIIVDQGVRLFKEGTAANNEDRRAARGSRRLKSRRRNRLNDMKAALKKYQIMTDTFQYVENPYQLRVKGLTQKLSNDELATICLQYAKRRGSSLDMVEDDESKAKELGETKRILKENDLMLKSGMYVCQIQQKRFEEMNKIHGESNNFRTSDYIKEARQILTTQELPEDQIDDILSIMARRRQYYEGPGSEKSPTIYGRYYEEDGEVKYIDLIEKMRGHCSIYPEELRAPKMCFSAELFNLLNDLNNLKFRDEKISPEQKEDIIQIVKTKKNITPKQLAKYLGVELAEITGFRINKKEEPILTEFKGYKILAKVFEKCNAKEYLSNDQLLDNIAEILTRTKGIEERKEAIRKLDETIPEECVLKLAETTGITGYHSISLKAIYELNKELLVTEMNQMQLIHSMQLIKKDLGKKGKKNIEADDTAILSPVAKRAIREAIKVVNAVRKQYGELDSIVVEMTRDKNSAEEKKRIKDNQKYFEGRRKQVDELVDGRNINAKTREKIRLYLDQDGKCAYSLQDISLDSIISDPTMYEVDHIIPISVSLDDSFNNKVLVTHSANQDKGKFTPYQAIRQGLIKNAKTGHIVALEEYVANILTLKRNGKISNKKQEYLLSQDDYSKLETRKKFVHRNLIDTSYACRVVLNTLMDYFKLNEIPTTVHTIRGSATNAFRKKIHLTKSREEDYSHHAIDALIVASLKKLNLVNLLMNMKDIDDVYDKQTGEYLPMDDGSYFDPKYIKFISQLNDTKVTKYSHKIDTKPNRQVADETIYSTRCIEGEQKLIKKYGNVYDPKFDKLTNDILNDEYQSKYLMFIHDPQTFNKIKQIVENHYQTFKDDKKIYILKKGKINLVGENPLYLFKQEHGYITKYAKKDNGPAITQMKYVDSTLGNRVDISKNYTLSDNKMVVLQQISPYRTDFYLDKDNKYKFVTIRYSNIRWEGKKNHYVISKEWYEEQKVLKKISSDATFCFSMHHDELIGFIKQKGEKLIYQDSNNLVNSMTEHNGLDYEILKFTATNNDNTNTIEVKPMYKYTSKRLMITLSKKVIKISKFATDPLGNLYEVKDSVLKLEF